jgi:hypothetical protein
MDQAILRTTVLERQILSDVVQPSTVHLVSARSTSPFMDLSDIASYQHLTSIRHGFPPPSISRTGSLEPFHAMQSIVTTPDPELPPPFFAGSQLYHGGPRRYRPIPDPTMEIRLRRDDPPQSPPRPPVEPVVEVGNSRRRARFSPAPSTPIWIQPPGRSFDTREWFGFRTVDESPFPSSGSTSPGSASPEMLPYRPIHQRLTTPAPYLTTVSVSSTVSI